MRASRSATSSSSAMIRSSSTDALWILSGVSRSTEGAGVSPDKAFLEVSGGEESSVAGGLGVRTVGRAG